MKEKLGDKQRLLHILDSIEEIESYIRGSNQKDFDNNSMMRFATVKQLEIIGEAVNHLSDRIKEESSEVDWKSIIGLRNIAVHEYFGIDSTVVWNIIKNDIPNLKTEIVELVKLSDK